MSLNIDVDKVTDVLLADGKWHRVDGASFDLDAYEFRHEGETIHEGGRAGVCSTGFMFRSRGKLLYGPLTGIMALRTGVRARRPVIDK